GGRDAERPAEPGPELGDLERRRLAHARALEVRRVDVGAVLPEQVVEAPGVAPRIAGADGEAEGVAPGDLLRHGDELVTAGRHLRLSVGGREPRLLQDYSVCLA